MLENQGVGLRVPQQLGPHLQQLLTWSLVLFGLAEKKFLLDALVLATLL